MVSQESAPPQKAQPENAAPALIVDAMLGRLARWLRLAGYDAVFWREGSDEQLIAAAREQRRLIITKDRALAARRGVDAVRIDADALDGQMAEARKALALRGAQPEPFTRCAECNGPVAELPRAQAEGAVPPYVWLLGVSLIFDLATMALASRIAIVPLSMNSRVVGFISGVVLYMLILHGFGPGAATT